MPAMVIQTTTSVAAGTPVGGPTSLLPEKRTFHATVVGTGAVTATVKIYGSNHAPVSGVGQYGVVLGTITLSGNTSATDGFTTDAPWLWTWSDTTAITGTGATMTATMGTP